MYSERHFFGSEHGKCESDAETGVVSKQMTAALKTGNVIIRNASEMLSFLGKENQGKQRIFKLIEPCHLHDIPLPNVKTLSDGVTRSLHHIKPRKEKGDYLARPNS